MGMSITLRHPIIFQSLDHVITPRDIETANRIKLTMDILIGGSLIVLAMVITELKFKRTKS